MKTSNETFRAARGRVMCADPGSLDVPDAARSSRVVRMISNAYRAPREPHPRRACDGPPVPVLVHLRRSVRRRSRERSMGATVATHSGIRLNGYLDPRTSSRRKTTTEDRRCRIKFFFSTPRVFKDFRPAWGCRRVTMRPTICTMSVDAFRGAVGRITLNLLCVK